MANALYDTGRAAFLNAGVNWTSDTIKAVLVDTGQYTPSLSSHAFLSDIAAGARTATLAAGMSGKGSTAGVASATNITFATVSGVQSEAVVLYKDTGTATTSQLIAYIDTATGLPVTPNGGDITVAWDTGANKIFKL